jgi:hypothetical protein
MARCWLTTSSITGQTAIVSFRGIRRPVTTPRGPRLIIANHVTAYDVPLVLYGLPPALRYRIAVAMSGEMLLDFRLNRSASNALHGPGSQWSSAAYTIHDALMPLTYWLLTTYCSTSSLCRALEASAAASSPPVELSITATPSPSYPKATAPRTARSNSSAPASAC